MFSLLKKKLRQNPNAISTSWGTKDIVSIEAIAQGAFGTVYKARGIIDQQIYAVKEIQVLKLMHLLSVAKEVKSKKDCLLLLQQEAKILLQLKKCKYVVSYHGCWFDGPNEQKYNEMNSKMNSNGNNDECSEDNRTDSLGNIKPLDCYYIKTDYYESDLGKWLYANPTRELRSPHIFTIFEEMLKGLEFIHSKGIIHRNIQPAIIFLDFEDGASFHIKIGSFSLAKSVENNIENRHYELMQLGLKTMFQSPEIQENGNDYDFKTDIYSCGLVVFEVINPSLNNGTERFVTFEKIHNGTYIMPPAPQFSKQEFELVSEMTKINKAERISAKEALEIFYKNFIKTELTWETFNESLSLKIPTSWGTNDLISDGEISRGSFGTVYKAHTLDGREEFAVKEISVCQYLTYSKKTSQPCEDDNIDKWILQLVQEVKILEELKECEFVVSYFESWFKGPNGEKYNLDQFNPLAMEFTSTNTRSSDYYYIKMELCGLDLREWLVQHSSVESRNPHQPIFSQILKGLEFIHSKDVIHRDIKPENIFIKTTNPIHIQIGDFGLSKLIHTDSEEHFTSKRKNVGTPIYRSPEMALATGRKDYDFKTDVYSVGLVFLEIINPELNDGRKRKYIFKEIRKGIYLFPCEDACLKEEYELIQKMTKSRKERLLAKEALDVVNSLTQQVN